MKRFAVIGVDFNIKGVKFVRNVDIKITVSVWWVSLKCGMMREVGKLHRSSRYRKDAVWRNADVSEETNDIQ